MWSAFGSSKPLLTNALILEFLPLQGFNVDQYAPLQPITAVLKSSVPSASVVLWFCLVVNHFFFPSRAVFVVVVSVLILCILFFDVIYKSRK